MARYNTWMNEKIFALCATLSDEERKRDLHAFFRSIHGTLNHILLADRAWLRRFCPGDDRFVSRDAAGEPIRIRGLDHQLYEDFDTLRAERRRTDAEIEAWVAVVEPDALDEKLAYTTSNGMACRHPTWWALSHFFNHQTHHRGQVTTLLHQLDRDPGTTDLLALLREESAR